MNFGSTNWTKFDLPNREINKYVKNKTKQSTKSFNLNSVAYI